MIFEFKDPWDGWKMEGYFKFGTYGDGGRVAISIHARRKDDPQDFFQPYCSVTVNLPNRDLANKDEFGFVDVNNAPWLEGFLASKGFGMPTSRFATSGFCNYPEYFFNIQKMKYYRLEGV